MNTNLVYTVLPTDTLQGRIVCPGDKSISHRSAILSAMATGTSELQHFLDSADCLATLTVLKQLGVTIVGPDANNTVRITGVGLKGLQKSDRVLDCGNSGTALRLLLGVLAAQPFESVLTGDVSLCKRPMGRVIEPLRSMGAQLKTDTSALTAPIHILPASQPLHGIDYTVPMASAQVQSCLLLAGLYAKGTTRVCVPAVVRDHSVHLLKAFGAPVQQADLSVSVSSISALSAQSIRMPGDISAAAFFMVGAAIAQNADITLTDIGLNPTRTGVLTLLQRMGACIEIDNVRISAGEKIGDVRVKHSTLTGIHISAMDVPLAIDELPVLLLAASCAQGVTVLQGAQELRVKESDRLAAMAEGLATLGVELALQDDGMIISGMGQGRFQGGVINSYTDHRIAMTFAMAALRSEKPIIIQDCDNVATSFPNFVELAQQAGLALQIRRQSRS